MRRIAYRIYDPEAKKFVFSGSTPSMLSGYFGQTAALVTLHDMEHQSITGLKDKNGVEIYEGDMVDIPDIGIEAVAWNPEAAGFTTNPEDGSHMMGANTCEVIGNIYEHKHLLEGGDAQPGN